MSEQTDITNAAPRRRRLSFGRLVDDFIVLATGQFLSKLLGFFAFAWLARILTVEEYGAVETAVGMGALGIVALELGTAQLGVRRIVQGKEDRDAVLGSVITARMMLAIVIVPMLALFYSFTTSATMPDLLFWLFAASLFAIPFNHNWFFQSQEKMAIAGFGQTLKMGVFLLAIHLLAPNENGVTRVGYAEIIAASAMALWYSILAWRLLRDRRPAYKIPEGKTAMLESAPLGASAFMNTLAQQVPLMVVASMSTAVAAAHFGASQRVVVSLITFSFIYYFNLYPLFARLIGDNPAALARIVAASARVAAWAGVFVASCLFALAPLVMRAIFGREFEAAGDEFGLLVWTGPLILASGNARVLLVAGKREGSLLWAQCVNAATILCVGLLLAPEFGGRGAAIGAIAGALTLWIVAHTRTRGLPVRPPLADNIPAAVAAAAVILSLTLFKPGLLAGALLAMTIVVAGMALDRGFFRAVRTLAAAKSVL